MQLPNKTLNSDTSVLDDSAFSSQESLPPARPTLRIRVTNSPTPELPESTTRSQVFTSPSGHGEGSRGRGRPPSRGRGRGRPRGRGPTERSSRGRPMRNSRQETRGRGYHRR